MRSSLVLLLMVVVVSVCSDDPSVRKADEYRFGTSHHVVLEIEQYQESFFVPPRPKTIAAIGRVDAMYRVTREKHAYILPLIICTLITWVVTHFRANPTGTTRCLSPLAK